MLRRTHHTLMLAVVICASAVGAGAEDEPPTAGSTAPYELTGPYYPGHASIPWHGVFSPDGRWFAVVEGHDKRYLAIFDAKSRKRLWRVETKEQPASHRPVFTRDGERLILVEGDALVVRSRTKTGWKPVLRVPLGFKPGFGAKPRAVVLAPDEKAVVLLHDERAYRVALHSGVAAVVKHDVADVVSVHFLGGRLALSRWSDRVAETRLVGSDKPLPFAVLAASKANKTWLVARKPRSPPSDKRVQLHLVDATSHAALGVVPIAPVRRVLAHLTAAVFSPDEKYIVTIESRRTARVRDARTGRLLQRIRLYEGDRMIGAAFSPGGRTLVTAGRRPGKARNKTVLLWRLRTELAR